MENKVSKTVTLVLNQAEITWLKNLTQNPTKDISYDEEDEYDKQMRETFWKALTI